ncbi:hypothetical protein SDC9_156798 [bioreactor metagenome]|uniref:Uncharacterized protein n=1 Tax=bioreactor metagenome TaxID=1076179 RepID=A0A645F574_9ZZZZ
MSALVTSNDTPRASVSGVVYVLPSAPVNDAPGLRPARYAEPPAETAIVGTGPPLSLGEAVRNIGSPVKMSEEVIVAFPFTPPVFITQLDITAESDVPPVTDISLPEAALSSQKIELIIVDVALSVYTAPPALTALLPLKVQPVSARLDVA